MTQAPPPRIGLCPNPDHYGEFYVPLEVDQQAICPACNTELIAFTREAEFEGMPEGGWLKGHQVLWKRRWPGQVVETPDGRPGMRRRYLVQIYRNDQQFGLMELPGEDLVHERRGRQRRMP